MRLQHIKQEEDQLTSLLKDLDNIGNIDAANRWLNILRDRSSELLSVTDISKKESLHRNNILNSTYQVNNHSQIKRDSNQLPGVKVNSFVVYYQDAYYLWKMIREAEKH